MKSAKKRTKRTHKEQSSKGAHHHAEHEGSMASMLRSVPVNPMFDQLKNKSSTFGALGSLSALGALGAPGGLSPFMNPIDQFGLFGPFGTFGGPEALEKMKIPVMSSYATYQPNYSEKIDISPLTYDHSNIMTPTNNPYPLFKSPSPGYFGDYDIGKNPMESEMLMHGGSESLFYDPVMSPLNSVLKALETASMYQHRDEPNVLLNKSGRSYSPIMKFSGSNPKYQPHPTIDIISQLQ
jgi:hypothetical protein